MSNINKKLFKRLHLNHAYGQLIAMIFVPIMVLACVGALLVLSETSNASRAQQRQMAIAIVARYQLTAEAAFDLLNSYPWQYDQARNTLQVMLDEKHLIRAGYSEPMISAICEHEEDASFFELYIQRMQGQKRKGGLIRNYDHANGRTEALTDLCHGGKTEYALPVAKKLIGLANSAQRIPPKIEQLFTALAAKIGRERNIAEGGRA